MTFAPSYVGIANAEYGADEIITWERDEFGQRYPVRHAPLRYFFITDEEGDFTSMFGSKLKKLSFDIQEEFDLAKKLYPQKFESDIGLPERILMDKYYGRPVPKLNFGFLDIEAEVIPGKGFSRPSEDQKVCFAPINAITVYKQWQDKFITMAVPPPGFMGKVKIDLDQYEYLQEGVEKLTHNIEYRQYCNEAELLVAFLAELEDFDFIAGWNSEFYDLPYIYFRTIFTLGEKAAQKLSFPGTRKLKPRLVEHYGKLEPTIQLQGRSHLDYAAMFEKFTFEGRESFALNAIATTEVKAQKLHYKGTLHELYHNDFVKFVHYNIVDVVLIKLINMKFKFVELVNQMAHENTVPFEAILGTTKYVDTGITNYAHNVFNVRVKDKDIVQSHGKVEGAIVLTPNRGLHKLLGSVDIRSLYPSIIRSLNLSPEKVIGQFDTNDTRDEFMTEYDHVVRQINDINPESLHAFVRSNGRERDWLGIRLADNKFHTAMMVDGTDLTMTGKEWKKFLKENQLAVSAYGTILDQGSGVGIMPATLGFWFEERLRLNAEKKKWSKEYDRLKAAKAPAKEIEHAKEMEEYYDLLQLTKKIQLNSAYGALLAKGFRWGAENIGASVTYSGRAVTTHMIGEIGETLTGERALLIKTHEVERDKDGNAYVKNIYNSSLPEVVYSDTDSVAFDSLIPTNLGKKTIEELFNLGNIEVIGDKEYSFVADLQTFVPVDNKPQLKDVKWIYRHKVTKGRWKVTLESGKEVIVTEDHSIMVERDGKLVETSAKFLNTDTDICISIVGETW